MNKPHFSGLYLKQQKEKEALFESHRYQLISLGLLSHHFEKVEGGPAIWAVNHKVLTVELGTGDIETKQGFCDIQ